MYNRFATNIVMSLLERAPAVLLADVTGESDRTWRARMASQWEPGEGQRAHLDEVIVASMVRELMKSGGWLEDEAEHIIAGLPSVQSGSAMPTADLIYAFSPRHGAYCRETILLAACFDQYCNQLELAIKAADVRVAQSVLCDMFEWVSGFITEFEDSIQWVTWREQIVQAVDMPGLLEVAAPIGTASVFCVLSSWDVEFCAGYFETMQAIPLFSLVMPRFSPDIEIEAGTGRLSRNGRVPRQRLVEPAIARLVDFVAVLLEWAKTGVLPQRIPRSKDFAAWCDEDLARVYSWRDGSTHLTPAQLERLWCYALKPDGKGVWPAVPLPMLICAHLWSPLLTHEQSNVCLIDCIADYSMFWRANHNRLVAGGLQFGEKAWPAFWTSEKATRRWQ